jgi:hypothetical protein
LRRGRPGVSEGQVQWPFISAARHIKKEACR